MQGLQMKLTSFVIWVNSRIAEQYSYSFARLKLRLANERVKLISRGTFILESNADSKNIKPNQSFIDHDILKDYESVNRSGWKSGKQSNKLETSYASICAVNHEHLRLGAAMRQTFVGKIFDHQMQSGHPDGFLESWMTRQQGEIILPENYIDSETSERKISEFPEEALEAVRRYKFSAFSKRTVKKVKSWFFTQKNPLQYQKESLSEPLIHLPDHLQDPARQLFDQIRMAGGQIRSEFPPIYHIYNIIETVIGAEEDLREEVFLQVIKQASSLKISAIQILCCLSATVKPSTRLYLPLLNYFLQCSIIDFERRLQKEYSYCFSHIIKNFEDCYKGNPSMFELSCYCNLKKIPITIAFPREKTFFIQSTTKVQSFLQEIIDFYNLDPDIEYLIYIGGRLLENGRLLDQYSRAIQRSQESAWEQYINFKGFKAVIVLKNMMQLRDSNRCFNLIYNYFAHQYLRNCFRMRSAEMVKVAGLILISETNNQQCAVLSLDKLLTKRKFMELYPIDGDTQQWKNLRDKFRRHIVKNYFEFQGTRLQARKMVLKTFQSYKGFLTHFFICKIAYNDDQEYEARIGLKWNKLLILDAYAGRVAKTIKYSDISDWGSSKSQICFKIDGIGDLHCTTVQVKVMASIFQSYIDYGVKRTG